MPDIKFAAQAVHISACRSGMCEHEGPHCEERNHELGGSESDGQK